MIRLTVVYPSTEGATFDHDYYRDKHVPLAAAMGAAGTSDVLADVANYTSIAPVLQTSEMVE